MSDQKIKRKKPVSKKGVELPSILPSVSAIKSEVPHFSPKKTRNIIKIEYEKDKIQPVQNDNNSNLQKLISCEFKSKKKLSSKRVEKIVEVTTPASEPNISKVSDKQAKNLKWEPPNWRETLDNIRKSRREIEAPVDTMGCAQFANDIYDEKTKRYHTLVSLMLSSQTKDQVNFDAMNRLKKHGLTPENIVKTDISILEELIKPVSFFRVKSKHVKLASQILINEHDSDIPNTIDNLLKLPGVGKKMAHICMHAAWNIVTGIGVDTHVHRISNWLKLVPKPTKSPEETRVALESWLPFELWDEINLMLVGFGQTVCTPVNPKCDACPNASICPARGLYTSKKKKKIV